MTPRTPVASRRLRRARAVIAATCWVGGLVAVAVAAQESTSTTTAEAQTLVNPVPYDGESIARGRKHYLRQGTHRQPYTEVKVTSIVG